MSLVLAAASSPEAPTKPPPSSPHPRSSTESTAPSTFWAAPASKSWGAAQTPLGPQGAPTSRCDHRTPNVMGWGHPPCSYLQGRAVLKPSQTDG